jgi:GH24 family phage-related lysozyme (muramidase)
MKNFCLILLAFALARAIPVHESCQSVDCTSPIQARNAVLPRATDRAAIVAARAKEAARRDGGSAPATPAPAPAPKASSGQCAASAANPNAATISLIKEREGFVKAPAPDPIGLPTVGFGHLCKSKGCAEVPFKFPLTEATATQLFDSDAKSFINCLHKMINNSVKLNDNQFGALTSFAFNLGCGAVQSSTLLKRLNAGENPNTVAEQEMPKFNKAGGKVLKGLSDRRAAEVKLFKKASSTIAHPLC